MGKGSDDYKKGALLEPLLPGASFISAKIEDKEAKAKRELDSIQPAETDTGKMTDAESAAITDEQRRRLLRRTMYAQQSSGTTTGATKLGV